MNRITHQMLLSSIHPEMDKQRRSREIGRLCGKCHRAFRADFLNFLQANWIRPEDLWRYREAGTDLFKLSGRTFTTEGIVQSLAAYASGSHEGNVLDYLKPDISGAKRYGFSFLSGIQVSEYFEHVWRGCRGGQCETCLSIATELTRRVGFKRETDDYR